MSDKYKSLDTWFPAHERFNIVFAPFIPSEVLLRLTCEEHHADGRNIKHRRWCPICEAEEHAAEVSRWENEGGK